MNGPFGRPWLQISDAPRRLAFLNEDPAVLVFVLDDSGLPVVSKMLRNAGLGGFGPPLHIDADPVGLLLLVRFRRS